MEGTAKTRSHSLKSVLFQWETMIFVIFIIINIININLSSNYLNFNNMMNNMVVFMDKALMVFTTMMVLLLGEIDISIASIMCLSGCCAGVAFEAGLPIVPAMVVGVLVGAACGFFNGILLVAFPDLNSTIVTLGNQILFHPLLLENYFFAGETTPGLYKASSSSTFLRVPPLLLILRRTLTTCNFAR